MLYKLFTYLPALQKSRRCRWRAGNARNGRRKRKKQSAFDECQTTWVCYVVWWYSVATDNVRIATTLVFCTVLSPGFLEPDWINSNTSHLRCGICTAPLATTVVSNFFTKFVENAHILWADIQTASTHFSINFGCCNERRYFLLVDFCTRTVTWTAVLFCHITVHPVTQTTIANESVPIQLAQCRFPGLAISNAKI